MDNIIILDWKEFSVNLDKVNQYFRITLSSNYDGLLCDENNIKVVFLETCIEDDSNLINDYWNTITEETFEITIQEIVSGKIENAQVFGNQLLNEFATDNVLMGITQAGQTIHVTDYLHKLSHYILTGSLYAAIQQINNIIADTSETKENLSPFVTNERMVEYKHKIQDFLEIPRT